ncbi:MAG: hypothetical protein K2L34_12675 [Muribaculaceae bacterium]|nr:hypothetical protein [Muribaculaceae bacterium]
MINVYLESKNSSTPEYVFVNTLLRVLNIPQEEYNIIPINGKDSLHLARNQFIQNTIEGGLNLIVFDADYPHNHGGYQKRKEDLLKKISDLGIEAELLLFPNNVDDGDFELLLEMIARRDLHRKFFDCFHDYEMCLGDTYVHPNRKGKMHTYITSMPLSNTKRNKIGSGEWLFTEEAYWNLNSPTLDSLKHFFQAHFTHQP